MGIIPAADPSRDDRQAEQRAKAQRLIDLNNERTQTEGHALGLGLGKFSNDSQENA